MTRERVLKGTVLFIAVIQLGLGLAYGLAPAGFHAALGLTDLPDWVGWPFGLMGARFIAFGFGMVLVYRDPWANRSWIQAMILVQAIDWIATIFHVATGVVRLAQVTTASFLPLLFVITLTATYPRAGQRH